MYHLERLLSWASLGMKTTKVSEPKANVEENAGRLTLSAWCLVAAFGTYFCMYAFRKPFTAASYAEEMVWGIGYKTVLVTAQVLGYMLSKFLGIKVIAEIAPQRRIGLLLVLIGVAEVALLLFAMTPAPWNAIWMFVNGLPLGLVFGLVLGFLEGRRQTEALTAGLCASFIVADGVVKSVGASLLRLGVSEAWMPFLVGFLFVPPLLLFVGMLTRIPAPSRVDVAERGERVPMAWAERGEFFHRYRTGLILLVLAYTLITILRSVRADFAPEIWAGLGVTQRPEVFAWSEILVAAGVLTLNGSICLLRRNALAFFASLGLAITGALLVPIALLGREAGELSPLAFMVLHGLGLYLPYVAVHTTIFERLLAMTQERGNIGYLMYLADAFGYLGYVAVMLLRNGMERGEHFLPFFVALSWGIAGACVLLLLPCWRYFATHPATQQLQLMGSAEKLE